MRWSICSQLPAFESTHCSATSNVDRFMPVASRFGWRAGAERAKLLRASQLASRRNCNTEGFRHTPQYRYALETALSLACLDQSVTSHYGRHDQAHPRRRLSGIREIYYGPVARAPVATRWGTTPSVSQLSDDSNLSFLKSRPSRLSCDLAG